MEFEKFSIYEIINERSDHQSVVNLVSIVLEHMLKYAEVRPQNGSWVSSIYNSWKLLNDNYNKNSGFKRTVREFNDNDFNKALQDGLKNAKRSNNNRGFNIAIILKYVSSIDDAMNKDKLLRFLNDLNKSNPPKEQDRISKYINSKDWSIY